MHSHIGDLKLKLIAPDGTSYVLHDREGTSEDNIRRIFEVPLHGLNTLGTWSLWVADYTQLDTGTLQDFKLSFSQ